MATAGELALIGKARAYADTEQRKTLRWFVATGDPIPTSSDVERVQNERAAGAEVAAADVRRTDRSRTAAVHAPFATIPATEHPAFQSEPDAAPTFAVDAASGVERKKELHGTFTSACWLILARARVERRLQRLAAAQRAHAQQQHVDPTSAAATAAKGANLRAQKQTDTRASSKGDGLLGELGNITLLSLPMTVPGGHSRGPGARSGGGGSASKGQEAADAPVRSTADLETFDAKELKTPFEFRLKDYGRVRFSDHHFSNCDPPEVIANLPAGVAEVAELNADSKVPRVEHFVQPVVTLETYPMNDFPYFRTLPQKNLVRGTQPQPVTDGGFKAPFFRAGFGHEVPSEAAHYDAAQVVMCRQPLPPPMQRRDEADDLSDDEDEGAMPINPPTSLVDVATKLFPPMKAGGQQRATSAAGDRPPTSGGATAGLPSPPSSSAPCVDAPLAWSARPVHHAADAKVNTIAAQRMAATAAALASMQSKLPPPQQLQF